ncbi:MAG: GDSL-type esterase/lipase family protein [Planctomycetota bacterium]|nr:GDSL-type esterase/lipase family protein [Planctomycetota bacterium]
MSNALLRIRAAMPLFAAAIAAVLASSMAFAQAAPAPAPGTATAPAAKIRVACMGDSITAGGYPAILGKMLGDQYNVKNFGISGMTLMKAGDRPYWTTGQIGFAKTFDPQIVTIMLGTNDAKPQNWNDQKKGTFLPDYEALIAEARAMPSHPRVYVMIPVPVFPPGAFGINGKVLREEITPVVLKAAEETKADVIDLYTPLLKIPDAFPDRVHPNRFGSERIAAAIYSAMTGAPLIEAAAPTFTEELMVEIVAANKDAVHYTLDGSEPTKDSPRFAEPFKITGTTTVKALGVGDAPSRVAVAVFQKVAPKPAATAPATSPAGR